MPKMDDAQFQQFVTANIRASLSYLDGTVAKRRERILNYIQYKMPDLPSLTGRSSVVDGTVGAQLDLMMPGLMRVMTGAPVIGEYIGSTPQEAEMAKQATKYVNDIVLKLDNEGESLIYNWGYDGLSQILGVVKGWWEEDIDKEEQTFDNVSDDHLAIAHMGIQQDPTLEITAHETTMGPDGLNAHSITVTKTINRSRICLDVIPPEEMVISADARTFDTAVLRSHRTYKRAGELIDMGYDEETVMSLPAYQPFDYVQAQTIRGTPVNWGSSAQDDPYMRMIAVHQGIVRCNKDGKGIKEWYFVAAGNADLTTILEAEPYDQQIFFADFCPKPIPHTVIGRCPGDDLAPIQLTKTAILRQTMDNVYNVNTPMQIVNSGLLQKGGLEALMNKVPNGIVLSNDVNAVRDLTVPFVAEKTFPMLAYFDDEAEKRTGVSSASMGLDPDVLQNQSATAANIAQSASMGKIEMIARIWATGGMRKLFRGILKMLKRYQDFPRTMKDGDQVTTVDPRMWKDFPDWDVSINTGLGTGSRERDMAMLGLIAQKQEQILLQGGPQNGIVTLGQYANTIRKIVETGGFQDASQFINIVPIDFTPPQPQPPPDPKMLAVQAKSQSDQAKQQLDKAEAAAAHEQQQMKDAADLQLQDKKQKGEWWLKRQEMLLKHDQELEEMDRQFQLDKAKLVVESQLELEAIQLKAPSGNGIIPN